MIKRLHARATIATIAGLCIVVVLLVGGLELRAYWQDTFNVQTDPIPVLEPVDVFGTSTPTDCRDRAEQREALRGLDYWSEFADRLMAGYDREIEAWRRAQLQTSCAQDPQFKNRVERYYETAREYAREGKTLKNNLVQCYRRFIEAGCVTEFKCEARPRAPLPNPPTCPGWQPTGDGRTGRRIDTGLPVRPHEVTQFPGLVKSFCGGQLTIELDRDMNVNLKKGTVVTFSVPSHTPLSGGGGRGSDGYPSWNSVTVEFYPDTGVATNVWFRGPGPQNWRRTPCSSAADADSAGRPRDSNPAGGGTARSGQRRVLEGRVETNVVRTPDRSPIVSGTPAADGFKRGFTDCVQSYAHLLTQFPGRATTFLDQFFSGQWEAAEATAGLRPFRGQKYGVTLEGLISEFSEPIVGETEYARGARLARRICWYGLPAGASNFVGGLKAFRPVRGKVPNGPPAGQPGSSERPLSPGQLTDRVYSGSRNLEGMAVQLPAPTSGRPPNVVVLGNRIGNGIFGEVYEIVNHPDLLKIVHNTSNEARMSIERQVLGSDRLAGLVHTPAIRSYKVGSATRDVSYLVTEDIRLHPDVVSTANGSLAAPSIAALDTGYGQIAKAGYVGVDLHGGNIYALKPNAPFGQQRLGVLDADMIVTIDELAGSSANAARLEMGLVESRAFLEFQRAGQGERFFGSRTGSVPLMRGLFEVRTGTRPKTF